MLGHEDAKRELERGSGDEVFPKLNLNAGMRWKCE